MANSKILVQIVVLYMHSSNIALLYYTDAPKRDTRLLFDCFEKTLDAISFFDHGFLQRGRDCHDEVCEG